MDDLNKKITEIPLSGKDLIEICVKLGKSQNTIKWILYDDLNTIMNIDELFSDEIDSVFILLQPPNEKIGHWILLAINNHGLVWYDPYGLSIMEDLEITKQNDIIIKLINSSGVPLDENTFQHQEFDTVNSGSEQTNINSCGRHTATRSFFSWMTNKQYNDEIVMPLIKNGEVNKPDTIVNLLTAFLSDSDKIVEKFFMSKVSRSTIPEQEKVEGKVDLVPGLNNQIGGVLLR